MGNQIKKAQNTNPQEIDLGKALPPCVYVMLHIVAEPGGLN